MLRCNRCGGQALATLGHLHLLTEHLCLSCTQAVVKEREGRKPSRREARKPLGFGDYEYAQEAA